MRRWEPFQEKGRNDGTFETKNIINNVRKMRKRNLVVSFQKKCWRTKKGKMGFKKLMKKRVQPMQVEKRDRD